MSKSCHSCWHDDPDRERCGIARQGYPYQGGKCPAYHPIPERRPDEPLESAAKKAPLSRLAGAIGWLFGGGA